MKKSQDYSMFYYQDLPILKFQEKIGIENPCILEDKITRFLSVAHKNHRHFRVDLYLNYLIRRAY